MSILGLTPSNFGKGKFELHSGMYETETIQAYIDKYERRYLIDLLGVDLFTLFVADLVTFIPQDAIYLAIFNSFEYDKSSCGIVRSEGMIEMLKGFIYFKYLADLTSVVGVTGVVKPKGENSEMGSDLNQVIYTRYNESIKTFQAIQSLICDNSTDYTTYNGQTLKTAYWL